MRLLLLCSTLAVAMLAVDPAGKWTASFDTQIGVQNYTYTFQVDGKRVTGTAENDGKKYEVRNGRIDGDTLTFLEVFEYQGQPLNIEYVGKVGTDEIHFTRKVAEFAVEEFVAKRVK